MGVALLVESSAMSVFAFFSHRCCALRHLVVVECGESAVHCSVVKSSAMFVFGVVGIMHSSFERGSLCFAMKRSVLFCVWCLCSHVSYWSLRGLIDLLPLDGCCDSG